MSVKTLLLTFLLALECTALAATNELKTELEVPKKVEVVAVILAQSTLHEYNDVNREADTRFNLGVSYPLSKYYRSSLSATVIQDLGESRKTTLGNAKLNFSHSALKLSQDTILLASAGVRLPTNVEDRKLKSYNGSIVVKPLLLTQWAPGGFTFTTIYSLEAVKNAHTYERTNRGKANLSYSLTNYGGVEKYLTKNISLLLDGDYTYARTYQNSLRTLFSFGQSLTYEQEHWSLTIGHSNGADALLANGTDYNVRVFDQNTSLVFMNMRVAY